MKLPELYYIGANNELNYKFHAGQLRAWNSEKRFVLVLAGTQGGKTSWGPIWLAREIQRCGPGDYLVAAPTFKLLGLKLFPEFFKLFRTYCKWGDWTGRGGGFQQRFLFTSYGQRAVHGYVSKVPTQIFFGHAANPDSLESATVKAAWLDECGQRMFKLSSWEAIQRRLAIHKGRVLLTTTPYTLGWLKDLLFDPWKKAKGTHPTIDVIQFKSTENPAFSTEEYNRVKAIMTPWRFRMFYDGQWEKPAGVIYESFDKDKHCVPPFAIPDAWKRYMGLDFGGVHTAAVYLAEEPGLTPRYYLYREYPPMASWVSATAAKHTKAMLLGEPRIPTAVGGSGSEDQWRDEFRAGGLPVREPPVSEVEVGIDRVHAAIKADRLLVFENCEGVLDELQNYSRTVDDKGEPLEAIEDKETYHRLDALRYIMCHLIGGRKKVWIG